MPLALGPLRTVRQFNRALAWVEAHSSQGGGIAVSATDQRSYPEVTGYFIPTLLAWNETDRAVAYGEWLLSCQHAGGYWCGPDAGEPYAFDTGQIIKGLLALAASTKDDRWLPAIRTACDWMCSLIQNDGRPEVPDVKGWNGEVPSGILLYAYQAVREAGIQLGNQHWVTDVDKLIAWFTRQPGLVKFTHLSHFHAYIMESLCDLGLHDLAREGMKSVARLQRLGGAVPARPDVRWVCSTGLFQYSIVWHKLGEFKRAEKAFRAGARLQNHSGGWYGSYGLFAGYFRQEEISWAIKYYLDALRLRLRASFEEQAPIFADVIDRADGRYELVREIVIGSGGRIVLDAGCGKGRYLRNLIDDQPSASFFASDLSTAVMSKVPPEIEKRQGSLLNLPYNDNSFDVTYTVEALEHAVHLDGAIRELVRVTRPGGTILIIDKDATQLGRMKLPDWEQWFPLEGLAEKLRENSCDVEIRRNVSYHGRADGLFAAWIAVKRSAM